MTRTEAFYWEAARVAVVGLMVEKEKKKKEKKAGEKEKAEEWKKKRENNRNRIPNWIDND